MSCPHEWCSVTAPYCEYANQKFTLVAACTGDGICNEHTQVKIAHAVMSGTHCRDDGTGVVCSNGSLSSSALSNDSQLVTFTCPKSCSSTRTSIT
jgi:hypothetical protein